MITFVTPTGDRPEAFSLCEYWMSRQTYSGDVQWIVVDDGEVPTCVTAGQTYLRRVPSGKDPSHTLRTNLAMALPHIKGDIVLIIEDDDYYSSEYVETMVNWLKDAELVGERGAKYYYAQSKAYYYWPDHQHASLCRTGFRRSFLSSLDRVLQSMKPGDWRVDLELWALHKGRKGLHDTSETGRAMCVGMKQLPGRSGVTHRIHPRAFPDNDLSKFREWIGPDSVYYSNFFKSDDVPIYTCMFGGYDSLPNAPSSNCYAVTDSPGSIPGSWNTIKVDSPVGSPKLMSRYWKMKSHELFPDSPSLYVDGNVKFKRPIKEFLQFFQSAGNGADLIAFRHNKSQNLGDESESVIKLRLESRERARSNLVQTNRNLPVAWCGCLYRANSPSVRRFNETWWKLFVHGSYSRDQLVFPIALKSASPIHSIVSEPTPFYGETSPWMTVSSHNKSRSLT